ncbi:tetratricopeptide repeat protein [Dapis sp. BLCC M229]|uniref:tetratricopeptide repeat protein n=1 Tax=Dapis sp. BLCC M229 TaxID=3400188 RepID=UPI003CF715F2
MEPKISVVNLHQKAEIYLAQGKFEEAIAVCHQALEIQPNYLAECHANLGSIYAQQKQWQLANETRHGKCSSKIAYVLKKQGRHNQVRT